MISIKVLPICSQCCCYVMYPTSCLDVDFMQICKLCRHFPVLIGGESTETSTRTATRITVLSHMTCCVSVVQGVWLRDVCTSCLYVCVCVCVSVVQGVWLRDGWWDWVCTSSANGWHRHWCGQSLMIVSLTVIYWLSSLRIWQCFRSVHSHTNNNSKCPK